MSYFRLTEAFWTRFGLHYPDDLGSWPQQQIDDFISIMIAEAAVSNEQNQGGNAASARADATQQAYEAMRAQARASTGGG